MTNREIIERLRKRIEEILRQYDPPESRKPHASTARSGAEAGGGYGRYPGSDPNSRKGWVQGIYVGLRRREQTNGSTHTVMPSSFWQDRESRLAPDSLALFLDIETTGLSGRAP